MRRGLARAHQGLSFVVLTASVVQFFLAGLGLWGATAGQDLWGLHMMLGMLIVLSSLLIFILALVARPGRSVIMFSALLFALMVVQMFLAHAPWFYIAALHPVNGLLVLFVAHELARGRWSAVKPRARIDTPAPAAGSQRAADRPADTTA